MDEEKKTEANEPKPPPPAPIKKPEPVDAGPTTPATAEQLTVVEEQMSSFEKSTLRWAKTAVIMSAIAALFVCAQWWEMHEGGVETHNLAVAANTQATQTTNLATDTHDLAIAAKAQSDQTKSIAEQAVIQANAAIDSVSKLNLQARELKESAEQTERLANETAKANTHAVEADRPWVGLSGPIVMSKITAGAHLQIEYTTKVRNFGRSPAFSVIPVVNMVVGERGTDIRSQIEDACKHLESDLLPVGVGEMVFPGDDYSFPTEAYPDLSLPKIPTNPNDPVYFFPGCILYLSGDGKVHHTKICQWIDKDNFKVGATFSSCSRQSAD